jgi:hypothetical protein
VPNAGASPMGSYYTAVLHLSDGTTSRQYWVVPAVVPGGAPATLAQIKNDVLPLSVAMQTVSKQYVDQAIAAVQTGSPLATSVYVPIGGGAMTGPLVLPADPVSASQAATKNYVDTNLAATVAGAAQKVSAVPTVSQAVAQPAGTNFSINGAFTSTTFSDIGKTTQATVTPATLAVDGGAGVVLSQNQMNCFQPGFDLGNNGTTAQGWSTCALESNVENSSSRGIDQLVSGRFTHNGAGDTAANYIYLTSFGAKVAASDEGVEHTVLQNHQIGFMKGTVSNGFAGSKDIYSTIPSGFTYLSPYDVIPSSGNLATITLNFAATPTAQTDEVVIATSNGGNSYTITNVIPVSVAAQAGGQTFTSGTGFPVTSVVAGQLVGLYVPTGTGPASDSINKIYVAGGPPSIGAPETYNTAGSGGVSISTTMGVPTVGAANIITTGFSCNGYCQATAGQTFADGGILLDTTQGGATATLGSYGRALNGMYYTLATGSVTVSTAWGNIVQSSCTNNGNGQNQVYASTTCSVTLGTSPASPGNFVAGQDIYLSGPFEEEAAVTAVGTAAGGVQTITFNTRYAWDSSYGNGNAALVMQGGPGGQAFVATSSASSWPVAYAVVGATSPTRVFFSNCLVGYCNGTGGTGNVINATRSLTSALVTRNGNGTVTAAPYPFVLTATNYPVGSTITVTGATPSDLNGTFTVLTNTYDNAGPANSSETSFTWAQTGVAESSNAGTISNVGPSITFYPSAFITGTNNGTQGAAQLATNTVPFTVGDTVIGAPSSEFNSRSIRVVQGQATPIDGSEPSGGISLADDGPVPMSYVLQATNNTAYGPTGSAFSLSGSYSNYLYMGYRPANNGTILYVGGGEPVSSNAKPYYIFQDNQSSASKFEFNPINGTFSLGGALTVPGVTAVNSPSAFAPGSTIGGVLPCLQNGTNCPAMSGGGGTGSVTSFGVGTWPSWLTPSVSNANSTPTISVSASAIPNASLANSATTVNGQTCSLGSTCTVPVGFAQVTGAATAAQLPAATVALQGAVILPAGATTNGLGAAAMLPGSIAVNGQMCALGGTCTVTALPPAEVKYYPAAACDGGTAYASAFTRYDNQQPQAGCVLPASSALGYLAFNATPASPQYAESTVATPPYWTGTSLYVKFYSQATSGTVTWYVQAACTNDGAVIGASAFGTPVAVNQAVSATAGGGVTTAVVSGIALPGANGCAAGTTAPGSLLTYRVYRSASDTAAGNANLLGVTLVTGRSQ